MLYIYWNEANETGVEIIDEQHRGIVSTINTYHYLCQSPGTHREAMQLTMGVLDEMTKLHFMTEEALMRKVDYAGYISHKSMHAKLVEEMNLVYHRSMRENDDLLFLRFLKKWWLGHISNEDMKYVPSMDEYKLTKAARERAEQEENEDKA